MLTLYKFELRKIISRKIVWITGGVLLVGLVIWGIASAVPVSYTHLDVYKRQPLSGEKPSQLQKKPSILQTMREQGEKVQTERCV